MRKKQSPHIKGITHAARLLGYHASYLSAVLHGRVRNPIVELAHKRLTVSKDWRIPERKSHSMELDEKLRRLKAKAKPGQVFSYAEIARAADCKLEYIRQIERQALHKLAANMVRNQWR